LKLLLSLSSFERDSYKLPPRTALKVRVIATPERPDRNLAQAASRWRNICLSHLFVSTPTIIGLLDASWSPGDAT